MAEHEILLGLPINSPLGTGENLTSELRKILEPQHPKLEIRRIETIGPKVGDELKISAVKAIFNCARIGFCFTSQFVFNGDRESVQYWL